MLITGSNMSGKSTFLRTLGVTAVLAQTLNTCLAAEYYAPVFNVRSCIGRSDDLLSGKSYYIAEVESLLGLVEVSAHSAPHLFLLDELFAARMLSSASPRGKRSSWNWCPILVGQIPTL